MTSPYRYVREPWASYRVHRRSDDAVLGWIVRDIFGCGWWEHLHEDGDVRCSLHTTREEAAYELETRRHDD